MTANEYGVSFGGNKKSSKLDDSDHCTTLCLYHKQLIIHCKLVNFMLCELYLNEKIKN